MARSPAPGADRKGSAKSRPSQASSGHGRIGSRAPSPGKGRADGSPDRNQTDKSHADKNRRDSASPRKTGEGKRAGEGWLYGRHPVEAALANPRRQLHRLLGTREALDSLGKLIHGAHRPAEILATDRATLDELLGPNAVHQGLALKAGPLPEVTPEDLVALAQDARDPVVMVLDQVTDPHNVGAVLRSAAAFGAIAVLVQDRHSPDQTGVLAKSASGTLEKVPLVRVANLVRALETLKKGGFWIAGLAADGRDTIHGANLSGKIALCLGSEGEGLRRLTREACDHLVRLPMVPGAVESLNVSNAAAVALYAVRQKTLEDFASPLR